MTQQDVYRSMTPAQRIAAACALHDFAFERLRLHLRRQHPEKTDRDLLVATCRRFLGDAAAVL